MTIAGIDLSTKKIAISYLEDPKSPNGASTFEVTAKGQRAADRFRALSEGFRDQMASKDTDYVFIEDISFSRNRQSELNLAQMLGAVKAHLYDMDRMFLAFNNQTVKAKFNLARASKQDIVAFVEKAIGLGGLTEDQADAFLVVMYGRSLRGPGG